MNKDIIYFELNNWCANVDYPNAEPFLSWLKDDLKLKFRDENWVKENKLCVVEQIIDMSVNWCITAKKEWVEQNCPSLLTEFESFQRYPDERGEVVGRFDTTFLEYCDENIGVLYLEEEY